MIFQEPEVQFVEIDVTMDATQTSNTCKVGNQCEQFGVETCLGEAPMNNCPDDDSWL